MCHLQTFFSPVLRNISLIQTLKEDGFTHITSGERIGLRPWPPRCEKWVWFLCEINVLRIITYAQTFLRGFNYLFG